MTRDRDKWALIERFCARDDLSSYDPYDIWKTSLGFEIKRLYNRSRWFAPLAAAAAAADLLNNERRLFYQRQEFPIVRAFAAMALLNLYERRPSNATLDYARRHLEWLAAHSCAGYKGHCWGLAFRHTVSRTLLHDANTPFSVITAYPLEAFVRFHQLTEGSPFQCVVDGIYRFFDQDIQVMYEDDEALATSYGPTRDRIVHNAISYTLYAYSLLLPSVPAARRGHVEAKIKKLYRYLRKAQRPDGSWFYSAGGRSFIDCFHSCILLKNLLKTNRAVPLEGCTDVVYAGYKYLHSRMLDTRHFLFKRFSVTNKPSLVKFDLYDNAEVLNLALLLGDRRVADKLLASVIRHFCSGTDIYSQIDLFGARRSKNTLRWAVMPFLYALSQCVEFSEP